MGACPLTQLTSGCLTATSLRLDRCHECSIGHAAEAIEAGTAASAAAHGMEAASPSSTAARSSQGKHLCEAQYSGLHGIYSRQTSAVCSRENSLRDVSEDDSTVESVLANNQDFAAELRGLSAELVRARLDRVVQDTREELKVGTEVLLDHERVTLAFDAALQCLDIREHGSLYPLAALGECSHLPRRGDGTFEVLTQFYDSEALTFCFKRAKDRAAFVLTLHALAAEARKLDKWHEDWGEGWEDETHDEHGDGGSPETSSSDSSGAGALLSTA